MRKKRQKKEKDENKPKRPPSAYFLFLGDMREKIKKDNPGISITEITKKAGEMWKEVTDKTVRDFLISVFVCVHCVKKNVNLSINVFCVLEMGRESG